MRVKLSGDRRKKLIESTKTYFKESHEQEIGDLKAGLILEFFVQELGPPVFKLAIRDAQAFFHQKIEDLEVVYYDQ